MRTILAMLLVAGATLHADTTTYNAQTTDQQVNPCQKITLSVAQSITPGGTTTTLYYKLLECAPGSTVPSVIVAEGNAAIPASAYQVQNRQTHVLRVQTPPGSAGRQGAIDLTWRATTENQTTFSGVWTVQQGSTNTRTTENQFFSSAAITGTVIGWTATGYGGTIGSQVQVGK